jgi:hypothetical protein
MAVYPRPEGNPFRNEPVRETLERAQRQVRDACSIPPEILYGRSYSDVPPAFRANLERERLELERRTKQLLEDVAREKRAREGVTDLVCINGVWQVPPK